MMRNKIIRFLLIFFLAGILGGLVFGFTLALGVLGLIYSPELFVITAIVISFFYIFSIWRIIKNKTYLVIIRKLAEIVFLASLLNAMFILEAEYITFNSFDWNVIYLCLGFATITFTIYLILEEYYNESWIYKEIEHIIKGMQIYGILPKDKKEK